MKYTFSIIILSIIINCCVNTERKNANDIVSVEKKKYYVDQYIYDSLTIPIFFKKLIKNHTKDFYVIDSIGFVDFCSANNIVMTDSANITNYFTISILHKIFTSQGALNCSKGEIINIPYQWHWVDSNPRYEIYFTGTKQRLKNTKPPAEHTKYSSYADIDRTPYFFLSDLFHPELKYYSVSCDTFSTFGWCSEREMAFTALMTLLNYESKVVAEGNHSWSELHIPMKLTTGTLQSFRVRVDNTFDDTKWFIINQDEVSEWKKYYGNTNQCAWYNKKRNRIWN